MTPDETRQYYEEHPRARTIALIVVCIGSMLNPLMLSAVNVAVPAIAEDLDATGVQVSWLPTAFMLASAIFFLPFGRLSDMYGRKKLYMGGLVGMSIGAAIAAVAPNIHVLLLARVIQGTAAAAIFGTGLAILTSIYPAHRLGHTIGIAASCVYIGLTGGPWFGGYFTEAFGWRTMFSVQIPGYLLVIAITLLFLRGEWRSSEPVRFDLNGAVLFGLWLISFVVGLGELPSTTGGMLVVAGAAGAYVFIRDQLSKPYPLVRLYAVKANRIYFYSILAAFSAYGAVFPSLFTISLLLQYVLGLSPEGAGNILLLQALAMAMTAPMAGRIADATGSRTIATMGCLIVMIMFVWLCTVTAATPIWMIGTNQFILGFGMGLFSTPNSSAAMRSLTSTNLGIASALVNLSRTLGQIFGIGFVMLMIAIFIGEQELTPETYPDLLFCIRASFVLSVVLAVGAMYFSWMRGIGITNKPE